VRARVKQAWSWLQRVIRTPVVLLVNWVFRSHPPDLLVEVVETMPGADVLFGFLGWSSVQIAAGATGSPWLYTVSGWTLVLALIFILFDWIATFYRKIRLDRASATKWRLLMVALAIIPGCNIVKAFPVAKPTLATASTAYIAALDAMRRQLKSEEAELDAPSPRRLPVAKPRATPSPAPTPKPAPTIAATPRPAPPTANPTLVAARVAAVATVTHPALPKPKPKPKPTPSPTPSPTATPTPMSTPNFHVPTPSIELKTLPTGAYFEGKVNWANDGDDAEGDMCSVWSTVPSSFVGAQLVAASNYIIQQGEKSPCSPWVGVSRGLTMTGTVHDTMTEPQVLEWQAGRFYEVLGGQVRFKINGVIRSKQFCGMAQVGQGSFIPCPIENP